MKEMNLFSITLSPWEEFLGRKLSEDELDYLKDGWKAISQDLEKNGVESSKKKYGCYSEMILMMLEDAKGSMVEIDEIINWVYSDYKDEVVETHQVRGTLDQVFSKMYSFERSSRYDNARKYVFRDKSLNKPYDDWKKKNVDIERYYGSGVVD